MKKILIVSIAFAMPAIASAQSLVSGYNFGQFIGSGYPALNGETFESVGSIGANFAGTVPPPASSSGQWVGNNSLPGDYSNGTGRVYWDGQFGSSAYDFSDGVSIVAASTGPNASNSLTVGGTLMGYIGDDLNLGLRSTVSGNSLAFVQNTLGYSDFAGSISNLTFAAYASGSPATINWYLGDSTSSFASTSIAAGTQFSSATVYGLDLPLSFYGAASSVLRAQIIGTVTLDNVQFNGELAAIPEPATYAGILGLMTLGLGMVRRRKKVQA